MVHFANEKRLQFKCNNSKSYAFSVIQLLSLKDYEDYCSDERVTQLKVISNMIFNKHKESIRRGVKFHATQQVLFQGFKMMQDDLTFADFQSAHDYLLEERGLDPDLGLLLMIEKLQAHLATFPVDKPRNFSNIEKE